MEIEKIISLLREFFSKQLNIQLSFLFGSYVKGYLTSESDIDVAILFDKAPDLSTLIELKSDLENILNKEIDIAILNTASPILKMQVLKNGRLIFKRDDKVYNKFFVNTINQYDDLKRVRKICEDHILKGRIYGR